MVGVEWPNPHFDDVYKSSERPLPNRRVANHGFVVLGQRDDSAFESRNKTSFDVGWAPGPIFQHRMVRDGGFESMMFQESSLLSGASVAPGCCGSAGTELAPRFKVVS